MIGNKFIKVKSKDNKSHAKQRLDFNPFTPWDHLTEEQRVAATAYLMTLEEQRTRRQHHGAVLPNKFLRVEQRPK